MHTHMHAHTYTHNSQHTIHISDQGKIKYAVGRDFSLSRLFMIIPFIM